MRIIGAIAIVAALGGAAVAGPKPTAKEAQQTVEAWLAALADPAYDDATGEESPTPKPALLALTAVPFRYETSSDTEDLDSQDGSGVFCKYSTITDPGDLGPPLACLRGYASLGEGDFKPWSKKIARHSSIAYSHKKDIRALEKTATLVTRDQPCAGQGQETLFAVTKDADGKMKVAAVYTFSYFCGE